MKYKTIENHFQKIDHIKDVSTKVRIILLKNKFKMKEHFDMIQEIKKSLFSDDYLFYVNSLKEIYTTHCEEKSPGHYIPKDKDVFEKAMNKFNEENSVLISSCKEREVEFSKFLEEDVKIEFSKYSLDDLPDDMDSLSKDDIELIFEFINN